MNRSRTLGLGAAAALLLTACAGGTSLGGSASAPSEIPLLPGLASHDPGGTLPESGIRARVVNFYSGADGPQDLDVYGFAGSEIVSDEVLIGPVAYATATDWFDPGFVENGSGGRTSSLSVHLPGDPAQVAGISSADAVAGTAMTVIVASPDDLGSRIRNAFDHHPDTARADIPSPIPDMGVLVTSYEALPTAEFGDAIFHASVGDSCLPGRFSDPAAEAIIGRPVPQPIGNDLVVEPGSYTLTIHRDTSQPGELAACDGQPVTQADIQIGAGERTYLFLYAAPGDDEVNVLALPFGNSE